MVRRQSTGGLKVNIPVIREVPEIFEQTPKKPDDMQTLGKPRPLEIPDRIKPVKLTVDTGKSTDDT
jgi:hypothetical protein